MKFIAKHYKFIIFLLIIFLIFVIFQTNNKDNQNYLSLGDGLSLGIDSYGRLDYGYSDYLKDYLKENNALNTYIKSFSSKDATINSLYENIVTNKKITLNNKEYNLKRTLRESTILTITIGLNDLTYKLSLEDNITEPKINQIIAEIKTDYDRLITEIKKYYQYEIYVIGYYDNQNKDYKDAISKLNNIFRNDPNVTYIDTYQLFKNKKEYLSNAHSYYPNCSGYKAISHQVEIKVSKKLEK